MIGAEMTSGSLEEDLSKSEVDVMQHPVVWEVATTLRDMSGIMCLALPPSNRLECRALKSARMKSCSLSKPCKRLLISLGLTYQ